MATITKSGVANLGSQQDLKNIKAALEADGDITVVDDPEVEVEQDEEGNDIIVQTGARIGPVEIEIDNVPEEEEEEEEE